MIKPGDGPQHALGDRRTADCIRQGQNVPLDVGGKAEQAHDLGYPSAGDALPAGDVGLVGRLAGVELGPPVHGLAEKLGHAWRPGLPWRPRPPGAAPALGDGGDHLGGWHLSLQGADVAVLEGALGAEGDLDGLVKIGRRNPAGWRGYVDDAEVDLGLGQVLAASNTVTLGRLFRVLFD